VSTCSGGGKEGLGLVSGGGVHLFRSRGEMVRNSGKSRCPPVQEKEKRGKFL